VPGNQGLFTAGIPLGSRASSREVRIPAGARIDSVTPNFRAEQQPDAESPSGLRFQWNATGLSGTATEPQKYPLSAVTFISSIQLPSDRAGQP